MSGAKISGTRASHITNLVGKKVSFSDANGSNANGVFVISEQK
jgi:hypothetical protein